MLSHVAEVIFEIPSRFSPTASQMDIRLPGQQPTLAQAVIAAANARHTPVVLLLFNGGMVTLDGIDTNGVAIMECWYASTRTFHMHGLYESGTKNTGAHWTLDGIDTNGTLCSPT